MTMNENIIEKKTHLSANVSFIHVIKHELLYLLDMKEKIKVCILGSKRESLYPYKKYSENIDIDRKC